MNDARHPLDPDLDRLFAAYREACDDITTSPDFMPRLWQRIDARRDALQPVVRHLTQFFAGLAAAASFALIALMLIPKEPAPLGYVDVLAQSHASDRAIYQDVSYVDALHYADSER